MWEMISIPIDRQEKSPSAPSATLWYSVSGTHVRNDALAYKTSISTMISSKILKDSGRSD